ncbi:pyridoxal 5'-phosphate synthase glutaminase subunit PdxT [Thermosphaera aggregans]|uniref:Pyridoxal 5'-phosphate synthase subunit PdxT n=1 Tax=Thermosphaera aggregans (strain DSM 11486 / M11TL) TaxID=633148 RepID=D5TZJ7_THEAM|nr:pyridoxal 5'-phosphate synthase glutaminase subunit PdxT [Thermosphaera aggregans]ADG90297.1 pyridoxal phosphate synthase yaaE subunit [Thermosphaera aggregans DSM 11486]
MKIGVLALQGDYLEHAQLLKELGVEAVYVKRSEQLREIKALIIPGGESTTIGNLISQMGLSQAIVKYAEEGNPVLGTCAGAIILAKKVIDRVVGETGQFTLGLMNIAVTRNAFGRQNESFEATVYVEDIGEVRAAFIRAPVISDAWSPAKITGYIDHPAIGRVGVAAKQGSLIAISFHPEITGDKQIYEYLISLAKK